MIRSVMLNIGIGIVLLTVIAVFQQNISLRLPDAPVPPPTAGAIAHPSVGCATEDAAKDAEHAIGLKDWIRLAGLTFANLCTKFDGGEHWEMKERGFGYSLLYVTDKDGIPHRVYMANQRFTPAS